MAGKTPYSSFNNPSLSRREKERLRKTVQSSVSGAVLFTDLDFTGANITSITTRAHNNLQSFDGGTAGQYYHLTQTQHTNLTSTIIIGSVTDAITAGTTQTQAGATALTSEINRVTVSAVNGDGVKLPTAVAGYEVLIINDDAAQTIQIWPASGDAIDGGAVDAADVNTLAAGAARRYITTDTTNWYTA